MALTCVLSLSILLCSIEIVKLGDDVGLELFKPGIEFVKQLVEQLVKPSIQLACQTACQQTWYRACQTWCS
jgi:hypothetical protein